MNRSNRKLKTIKLAIVASKFNEFITRDLLDACLTELVAAGVNKKNIKIIWVPGSFEIPLVALTLARAKNISGVICLGAVIRGETLHFELVAHAAAEGIAQAALMSGKPVIFGVLSTDSVEQAYKRSQKKGENKGRDAAITLIEMVQLMDGLKKGQQR